MCMNVLMGVYWCFKQIIIWCAKRIRKLHSRYGATHNVQYQFYPVLSGSVQFEVQAAHDAHIALTGGPQETDPIIEVCIGGWSNTKSAITKNRTKPEKVILDTPEILDGDEFRGFWIRWDDGIVSVGYEGEAVPFLSWSDPEPFPIGYVGVCTGWGATGTWKIEDGAEFDTPDNLEYVYSPSAAGSLEFEYRGPYNCHVCLTTAPAEVEPIYELMLGGWENTQSVIRYNKQKPDKVTVPTPGLMNGKEFRRFIVEWRCGRVAVRDGQSGDVIMEWTNPEPFPITHFGMYSGEEGQWRIIKKTERKKKKKPPAPRVASPQGAFPPAAVPQTAAPPAAFPPAAFPPTAFPQAAAPGAPPPVHAPYVWVNAARGQVPLGALAAGVNIYKMPVFIARASIKGLMTPGSMDPSEECALVPWGGRVHYKYEYQVLVGGPHYWVPTEHYGIPPGAFPAGETETGEPLFIGRVHAGDAITPGKVQRSQAACFIAQDGHETKHRRYDILVL